MNSPAKFLLLPICGLGDVVCYIPFVQALRRRYADAEITVIVATESARVVLAGASFNIEIIVYNRREQRWLGTIRLLRDLRHRKFDVVISGAHPNTLRVPLLAYLCGRKIRIGAESERLSFLYNRTVEVQTDAHAFERYRELLAGVGIEVSSQEYSPTIRPSLDARDSAMRIWANEGLDRAECVVGIASGADLNHRGRWIPSLKRWNVERYAEVASYVVRMFDARIVMFGSAEEAQLASAITAASGVQVVNLCGRTGIQELQWLLMKCTAFLSNDTGTMHLASALGTPVVALFGPTSFESFGPTGPMSVTIQGKAPCSPCYPHPTCERKGCLAMDDISTDQVITGICSILKAQKNSSILPISVPRFTVIKE